METVNKCVQDFGLSQRFNLSAVPHGRVSVQGFETRFLPSNLPAAFINLFLIAYKISLSPRQCGGKPQNVAFHDRKSILNLTINPHYNLYNICFLIRNIAVSASFKAFYGIVNKILPAQRRQRC
jgi:hypothetical protein